MPCQLKQMSKSSKETEDLKNQEADAEQNIWNEHKEVVVWYLVSPIPKKPRAALKGKWQIEIRV